MNDLARLVASMDPVVRPGEFVFCSIPPNRPMPVGVRPIATMLEPEGMTLVLPVDRAESAGLVGSFRCAWIMLRVRSELDAVGLTAAVATALAADGIACNVVAGFHHDHLFVPIDAADAAVAALRALAHTRT